MKRALAIALCLLGACELEPAPKGSAPAVVGSAATAPAPSPVPAPVPAHGAPTPTPTPTPNTAGVNNPKNVPIAGAQDPCTDAAVAYTAVGLAEARDPQMKQLLEVERARTVQRIAQGCRDQAWSPEIIRCYKSAKETADLRECTKKLAPPAAANAPKQPQPDTPPADKPAGKAPDKTAGKAKQH